jgi:tetratricopeptide (TPR) repeat protein
LDITLLDAYRLLGEAYTANEQPELAVKPLETYVLYRPEESGAWLDLGIAYQAAERHAEAIQAFNQAFAIDNRLYQVYLLRGKSYMALEDWENALADLAAAKRAYSGSFEVLMTYAVALFLSGNPGDAYMHMLTNENYAETDGEFAELYYWRAQTLEALDEPEAARRDWEALLALPEDVMPEEWRTLALEHLAALEAGGASPTPTRTASPTPSALTPTPKP